MVGGVSLGFLGGPCGLLGDSCGHPELTRRDADEALEVAGELALVGEAGVQGDDSAREKSTPVCKACLRRLPVLRLPLPPRPLETGVLGGVLRVGEVAGYHLWS
jgi:hypothetical protein